MPIGTLERRHVVRGIRLFAAAASCTRDSFWRLGVRGMGCQCNCQETNIFWCLQNERALLSAAIEARNSRKEAGELR